MATGRKADATATQFKGTTGKIPTNTSAISPGLDALNRSIQGFKDMVTNAKQKGLATAIADDAVTFSKDFMKAMTGSGAAVQDTPAANALKNIVPNLPSANVNLVRSAYGNSYASSGSATQAKDAQGKSLEQIINETVDKNNAWAAEQAQKQMDFQLMMSSTAHQRELEDLKKAGLNPVLSVSGGNGAAMASGAMAQPDTSNTRLLAEMALAQTEALGNSAVQLASGYRSKASNSFANSLLNAATKYVIPTLARGAARALTNGLFG